MVYINDQCRLIFIENPKSGSTTIFNALNVVLGTQYHRTPHLQCAHGTSEDLKRQVGETVWNSYLKVTTYRDPYKRFFSSMNYPRHHKLKNINCYEDLVEHIQLFKENKLRCQYCIPQTEFTDGMDFLIRLDHIQEDFDELCNRLGVHTIKIERYNINGIYPYTHEQVKELF